jgi:hypothetical protein
MVAGERVGILMLALLAASGLARAQEAASATTAPVEGRTGLAAVGPVPPLSIRSASLLRVASPVHDARAQARLGWPLLETVYDTPGSTRPSHRLELVRFGADSSVGLTYKRSRPQLVWRKSLD